MAGVVRSSFWLFIATAAGNACNFLYHLYMVRWLPTDHYAMLTALIGLMTILSVPATTIQTTTSHRVAQLQAHASWAQLRANLLRRFAAAGLVAVAGFVVIALAHRVIMSFLRFPEIPGVILGWGGVVVLTFLIPVVWGGLQGLEAFFALGINLVVSALLKLGSGVLWVGLGGMIQGAVYGLLAAAVVTLGLAVAQLRRVLRERHAPHEMLESPWWERAGAWAVDGLTECWVILRRPVGVSVYAVVVAVSVMAYTSLTNMDVILAKHYFEPLQAGSYAVGAMVSRMVLFLPMAFSMVLFPKVSQATALGQDAKPLLRRVVAVTAALSGAAGLICMGFPAVIMRILAGRVFLDAIPVVQVLSVAMACMSVANVGLVYLLATQRLRATVPYWIGAVAQVIGVVGWHATMSQVAVVTGLTAASLAAYSIGIVWSRDVPCGS